MDLEARTRDLADALARGEAGSLLSSRLQAEVDERQHSRAEVVAFLAAAPRTRPTLGEMVWKRNLVFCDGDWPGVGGFVAVLAWDQDGLLTSVTVQRR